jgi:2-keto-4-pentenoate hydratase
VGSNVFHCAVAFGRFVEALRPDLQAALVVNDGVRDAAPAQADVAERIAAVGRVLAAVDESLRSGDRIITGLVVQVPVASRDEAVADLGVLGRVALTIA